MGKSLKCKVSFHDRLPSPVVSTARRTKPRTRAFKRYCLLLLTAVFVTSAAAYDHPLESSAIRDAYFLGADNFRSVEFLSTYLKKLPVPRSGAYVSEVAVRTPFAQVVANSHDHSVGYSAQQAELDYRKTPGTVQVRIQILIGNYASGSPLQPAPDCQGVQRMNSALGCFHDFRFRFAQVRSFSRRALTAYRSTPAETVRCSPAATFGSPFARPRSRRRRCT
jgi:hypothetical protein